MYIVDTSAWIDFLRKKDDRLTPYLESREVHISDIVLYELLSGLPPDRQKTLRDDLSLFGNLPLTKEACLEAAKVAAMMRRKGLAPQTTDMLIAATALMNKATLIHQDGDFDRIAKFCSLETISFLT